MTRIILTAPRNASLFDRGITPVQDALDYIAMDINRLHRLTEGTRNGQFATALYHQTVGAINLLNHLTGYSEEYADARAEVEIAYRKAMRNITEGGKHNA